MSQSTSKRPIITNVNPKSPVAEAYRALRTNIEFSVIDEDLKVLMVTSAGPGEGKSTTLSNMAVAFAQSDKKVLIIDADLRKPTMHHTFNLTNRLGLSHVLANKTETKKAVQASAIPNLDVMTSGPVPPNPSEMLSSRRMESMLGELSAEYDWILIDTPPVIAVTDAQVVATKCDGVVLVVDSGKVKREVAIRAKANLEHVKARILGVVLNNVERKNKDAYYYYYGNNE